MDENQSHHGSEKRKFQRVVPRVGTSWRRGSSRCLEKMASEGITINCPLFFLVF